MITRLFTRVWTISVVSGQLVFRPWKDPQCECKVSPECYHAYPWTAWLHKVYLTGAIAFAERYARTRAKLKKWFRLLIGTTLPILAFLLQ